MKPGKFTQKNKTTNRRLREPSAKKNSRHAGRKNYPKTSLRDPSKTLLRFEIEPKFFETHVFQGTILYPYTYWSHFDCSYGRAAKECSLFRSIRKSNQFLFGISFLVTVPSGIFQDNVIAIIDSKVYLNIFNDYTHLCKCLQELQTVH